MGNSINHTWRMAEHGKPGNNHRRHLGTCLTDPSADSQPQQRPTACLISQKRPAGWHPRSLSACYFHGRACSRGTSWRLLRLPERAAGNCCPPRPPRNDTLLYLSHQPRFCQGHTHDFIIILGTKQSLPPCGEWHVPKRSHRLPCCEAPGAASRPPPRRVPNARARDYPKSTFRRDRVSSA